MHKYSSGCGPALIASNRPKAAAWKGYMSEQGEDEVNSIKEKLTYKAHEVQLGTLKRFTKDNQEEERACAKLLNIEARVDLSLNLGALSSIDQNRANTTKCFASLLRRISL
eukprot:Blabericola_migrator_1__6876@NODE_3480_length_1736_cov_3_517675_g2165_i0_p2_GENE_NODE_3480_length_1736_cov_3_517675_g2165_i0NODE_3480_length_1736_cov_3_517675_g2165_i0_p2_ORF_typecomplete_len111_score10_77VHS/PF00790_19/10VHS/PF00790_19/4_9_NODE_3480_length_1736_cov_3_517675_g2165_i0659991